MKAKEEDLKILENRADLKNMILHVDDIKSTEIKEIMQEIYNTNNEDDTKIFNEMN